jgi:hypothetical protein
MICDDHRKKMATFLFSSLAAAVLLGASTRVDAQVAMQVAPGSSGEICVNMQVGGQSVAGTQNDLTWDASCASLNGCQAGPHGKSLNTSFPAGASSTVHALVLSITDVNPIVANPLYCCQFNARGNSESCPVQVANALGSDPQGKRISISGGGGTIAFAGSNRGNGGGGGGGGGQPSGPLTASGGNTKAAPGSATGGASGGVAGGFVGGGQQQPPAVVVPGGVPGEVPPIAQAPGAGAVPGVGVAPGGAPVPARIPATPIGGIVAVPPTPAENAGEAQSTTPSVAPTTAATPAAKGETPLVRPTLRPTAKPTLKPTSRAQPEAAPKPEEKSSSWFGCQVASGAGDCSAQVIAGLLAFAALRSRRRRR